MSDTSTIELGSTLAGRYELVAEVARGAMGDVYEAFDRSAETRVAVKVLRAEYLSDDAMRRRFRREGSVLKSLDHPAIVRLLELGVDEHGQVFLVTEYVDGQSLAKRLERGRLSLDEADVLVEALCGALGAAHEHGVLHGDLKPSNVLWSAGQSEALPRLVDFGASKVLGLDRLTATGEVSGTPAYMAPEVLTGKGEVDQRIDVYGLGVLLYEALSATRPFQDAHLGRLVMKIDSGDFLPLDAVADVSAPLAGVIARAMQRDKSGRYGSIRELETAWNGVRGR